MLDRWLDALLDFALPRACVSCRAALPPSAATDGPAARFVCSGCLEGCTPLPGPRCARCGHPQRAGRSCPLCPQLHASIGWGRSAVWATDEGPRALLHAFKYDGWPALDATLAEWCAPLGPPPVPPVRRGVLVPIPTDAVKRRERGYNPTERLASALASAWRWPVRLDLLDRPRRARAQAQLHAADRRTNIQGCFTPRPGARLHRLHVCLVDDVITTGATLSECAAALCAAGADSISFITFGRARAPGER